MISSAMLLGIGLLFLILPKTARCQVVGILSDNLFDSEVIHEEVLSAWEARIDFISNRTAFTSHGEKVNPKSFFRFETVKIVDLNDPSDVMQRTCSILQDDTVALLAVTGQSCNPALAFLSSVLQLPILEIPMESNLDNSGNCDFSFHQEMRMKKNEKNFNKKAVLDGTMLGKYFSLKTWAKLIMVYDKSVDTHIIGTLMDQLGQRMRATTVQMLPITSDSHELMSDAAFQLVSDIINAKMWDIKDKASDSYRFFVDAISFVLLGNEDTTKKFASMLIPGLPYRFYIHFYMVNTEWTSKQFVESVLLREGLTTITMPLNYNVSQPIGGHAMSQNLSGKISRAIATLVPSLLQDEINVTIRHDRRFFSCYDKTKTRRSLRQLAKAIRDEGVANQSGSNSSFTTAKKKFPYFISFISKEEKERKSKLHACERDENGEIDCHLLMKCANEKSVENRFGKKNFTSSKRNVNGDHNGVFLKMRGWKNKTFRVATLEDVPFVFVERISNDSVKFSGFCIDMLDMLAEMMEFKYEMYEVEDRKYGTMKNGKWNGLVGEVVENKANFAIAAMTITPQREKAVDFTKRYMDYAVGILVKKPKLVTNIFSFLNPFDNSVWCSILAALVLVSILLFVLNRVSSKRMRDPPIPDNSLRGTIWFAFSSLVQQGTDMNLMTLSSQIATGVWWFFILVIMSSYTANLAAHLTVSRLETHVSSFRELASQTEMRFGTVRDTSIFDYLRTKGMNAKDYTSFWKKLWMGSNGTNSVSDPRLGLDRVKRENYAFLWDVAVIEYLILTDSDCSLTTVPDSIYDKGYGIAVQQGNPIREALSLGILQLQERGDIARMKQRWWTTIGSCSMDHSQKSSHSSALTLENFSGAFCILAGGLIIAFLVACCEITHYMKRTTTTNDRPSNEQSPPKDSLEKQIALKYPKVFLRKCTSDEIHIVVKGARTLNGMVELCSKDRHRETVLAERTNVFTKEVRPSNEEVVPCRFTRGYRVVTENTDGTKKT